MPMRAMKIAFGETIVGVVAEMCEEMSVHDGLDTFHTVLFRLPTSELLPEIRDCFFFGGDAIFLGAFLDIRKNIRLHLGVEQMTSTISLSFSIPRARRRTMSGICPYVVGKRDHEHAVFAFLHDGECAVSFSLREDFGDFNIGAISAGSLDKNPVWCKIFDGDQHTFGSVTNEIPAGIQRVFLQLLKFFVVIVLSERVVRVFLPGHFGRYCSAWI